MGQKNLMQIKEFARLTGMKPENLRFYDQMGLLSPEVRGENGYRYYSRRQLNSAYLISDLRDLDVGLEEIKSYSRDRTPEKMLALFDRQEKLLQDEIERLRGIRDSMRLRRDMAKEALRHGERDVVLEKREREPIFLCPEFPVGEDPDEGMTRAYDYADSVGIELSNPVGVVVTGEEGKERIASYYFKTRRRHNAWKPEGLYARAYGRCDLLDSEIVYQELLAFMREQGLRPCGKAYGECLLDEMAVQDVKHYGVRLEVPVERV